ncbi:MAG: enoyl-CoA hydratase/isomerase family protein [Bdellovibrionales bacterium]|nr:enoyl-CoA hydratase/isomerase family protein [Bdellovibrionales bacterium]
MNTLNAKVSDRVLVLTLDNVKEGNSFSLLEAKQLAQHLRQFRGQFDGVVMQAEGSRFFCTGGNLRFYAELKSRSEGLRANLQIRRVLSQFAALPQPKVALVQGDCLGGGLEVLSLFDHVIAAPHVFLGFWQRRLALTFGWGGGARWERKISQGSLIRLMIESRCFSSYEALRLGLVNEIQSSSGLRAAGERWLHSAMAWPSEPLPYLRQWSSLRETKIFARLWHNPSHKAVLARFRRS